MLNIKLHRFSNVNLGNVGFLVMDDRVLCHTLELPWKGNMRNVSCIPPGTYTVEKFVSSKFGRCFRLPFVPNRSGILIHAGNTRDDTQGCILVGQSSDLSTGRVNYSRAALAYLDYLLPNNFNLVII